MQAGRTVLVHLGLIAVIAACGSDDDAAGGTTTVQAVEATTTSTIADTTSTTGAPTTTGTTTTTTVATPTPTTTSTTSTTSTTTGTTTVVATTTTEPLRYEYPPVWPGPDDRLATPEAAAGAFVSEVLGVPPVLGDFEPVDARSGEIVVFSPTDDDDPATVFRRGLVRLRQLAPSDAWFVVEGSSEGVSITSPQPAATVPAGPLVVEGLGRGFESNVVIRALLTGDPDLEFDLQFTMTDWTTPTPYAVTLDLGAASPGDVVTIVAVGDTGLGVDPSEFAAIPVVIAG